MRVVHPVPLKETNRNPALMDESDGLPPPILAIGLRKQLASGDATRSVARRNVAIVAAISFYQ